MERITSEAAMLAYLDAHELDYTYVAHPPVFTCADVARVDLPVRGVETKNLFLRDARGSFFLVLTACEKRLDLKQLARALRVEKLHFGDPTALGELLGLTPGAVTVLGLVNDHAGRVQLLVDDQYWPAPVYLCHPLVNTATLALERAVLERFLALSGHAPRVVAIAGR